MNNNVKSLEMRKLTNETRLTFQIEVPSDILPVNLFTRLGNVVTSRINYLLPDF